MSPYSQRVSPSDICAIHLRNHLNRLAQSHATGEIASYMTRTDHARRLGRRLTAPLAVLFLLAFGGRVAQAQPSVRCDDSLRVRDVRIVGSPIYDAPTMALSIATQPATFLTRFLHSTLRIGELPCSDSATVHLDALRLAVMHRQAGWLQAMVTSRMTASSSGMRVLFEITPGTVVTIDSIQVNGLPSADTRRPLDAPLRALAGQRFDRIRLDTLMTATLTRLRDAGYARAKEPALEIAVDTVKSRVKIAVTYDPGRLTTLHAIAVDVKGVGASPGTIDTATVRGLTALRAGNRFRAADIVNAQRDLYRADVFRLVLIDTATPIGVSPDSLIDLKIAVAEARTRNARYGIGWATLDCIRTQARFVDRRFLGVGRRLELTARASRIGVGPPADFAPSLCSPALRADTQFTVLNHYLGATVSSTRLFGSPLSPVTTIYTERRSEPYAYIREIGFGALVELARSFNRRTSATYGLQYENGRTKIDPAESCSRFGLCRKEEYDQSLFGRGVGILSTTLTHDRTNNVLDPVRGFRVRGELRAGQTFSRYDTSLVFFRTSGEFSSYRRIAGGVLAMRAQLARSFAPGAPLVDGSPLIPQQERLFAGGQNTVRGYQQNLLGPLLYVVSDTETVVNEGVTVVQTKVGARYDRAVPRGGNALTIANLEYRRGFRWLAEQLQFATFVDVGNVWEGGSSPFRFNDLRATPGLGLRVVTGLGPFRVDVGYQPYAPRKGRALFLSKGVLGSGGTILCASPGNTVSIDPQKPGSIFDCPETYQPPAGRGVLSRLAFHFGLGQAF